MLLDHYIPKLLCFSNQNMSWKFDIICTIPSFNEKIVLCHRFVSELFIIRPTYMYYFPEFQDSTPCDIYQLPFNDFMAFWNRFISTSSFNIFGSPSGSLDIDMYCVGSEVMI